MGGSFGFSFSELRPQLVYWICALGAWTGWPLGLNSLQLESATVPVIFRTAHGTIPDARGVLRARVWFSFL